MGYDLKRINSEVDEELKCGICHQLLEDPVILSQCDHIFCRKCLNQWMTTYLICPIDRQFVNESHVKSAPKLFQNFITKYEIRCNYADNGCRVVVKVDKLDQHIHNCPFRSVAHPEVESADNRLKQLDSLESRVKNLEIENQWIRRQLDELKKHIDSSADDQNLDSKSCVGKMMVKVEDKSFVVDADPQESIERIKKRVQELDDMNGEEMLVYFANQELDPKLTLSDYRICKPMPHLFLSLVKKRMRISLRIDRERVVTVEVSPKHTVADVLAMVLEDRLLECKQYVVSYRNQRLDESRTLLSCKIRDGNYIFINTDTSSSVI